MYVFCVYVVDRICEWQYYYFNEYIHLIMVKYYVAVQFISITDDLFFDKNVFHFNLKRFIDPSDKWYSTLFLSRSASSVLSVPYPLLTQASQIVEG